MLVAFVDDHPTLLEGLKAIFGRRNGYKVVATGGCCDEALDIVSKFKPDVVVLDLNMPGNAFECIKSIRKASGETKIVAFTASSGINHAIEALQAGASGYVLKGSSLDSLTDAIDAVLTGDTYITKGFATKVIAALTHPQGAPIKLSAREEQIVALLLESRTNREMAKQLHLSEKTIKNYMTLLMQKLKVRNRVGLVMAARGMPLPGSASRDLDRIGLLN
ncbi:response regulator [Aminobacter aganoensis]|uniref:response regulator transcription factor n=1 Tax=Aminobacter aganoensis TaxID=83264 RepID=UPI0031B57C49